ncbi:MAG: hypothetical protein QOD55_2935 [Solirubrobacteraceae bacterium]|jgi:hypothetical protein|nr:hypothetical protein [Solirubrobacteraceae bacterium]
MSRRARDLLLGLALSLVAFGGVLWQVDQSGALRDGPARTASVGDERTSLPRLICPLH